MKIFRKIRIVKNLIWIGIGVAIAMAFLNGCGAAQKEIVFPEELTGVIAGTPEHFMEILPKDLYYSEDRKGEVYINEDGFVTVKVTPKQQKNWVTDGWEFFHAIQDSAETLGTEMELSDDMTVFTLKATDALLQAENPDASINAVVCEIAKMQMFAHPEEGIHFKTVIQDKDGKVVNTVEWPQYTGYIPKTEKNNSEGE